MAALINRNGVWYARFRHRGKEYLRSTHIKVPSKGAQAKRNAKDEAEAELYRMQVEVKGGESVDALFARLNEAIESLPKKERGPRRIYLSDRLRKGVSDIMAVDVAWDAWERHPNRGNASMATVKMYQAYWGRDDSKKGFKNWLKKRHPHVKALHEISRGMAEEYAAHLKGMHIAPRTYNGAIKFLASMFKTLKTRAGLIENVWEGISRAPSQSEGRRDLTSAELNEVCKTAAGDLRYLVALGIYSGLRLGDCVTLKWDAGNHVNGRRIRLGVLLDEKVIRVVPGKTRRKKKTVTIPLHPVLLAMLKELWEVRKDDGYLFPELAEAYRIGGSDKITRKVQKLFIACGIETTEEIEGRNRVAVRVGFHSLRHSFVSLCAANKVPQAAIQDLVGHGSPAMTALYTHADEKQRSDAINALPDIAFS